MDPADLIAGTTTVATTGISGRATAAMITTTGATRTSTGATATIAVMIGGTSDGTSGGTIGGTVVMTAGAAGTTGVGRRPATTTGATGAIAAIEGMVAGTMRGGRLLAAATTRGVTRAAALITMGIRGGTRPGEGADTPPARGARGLRLIPLPLPLLPSRHPVGRGQVCYQAQSREAATSRDGSSRGRSSLTWVLTARLCSERLHRARCIVCTHRARSECPPAPRSPRRGQSPLQSTRCARRSPCRPTALRARRTPT